MIQDFMSVVLQTLGFLAIGVAGLFITVLLMVLGDEDDR